MGLKHAIHTLVRRDASPAHETKAGPAAKPNNESFKSIRNFVYVFVHRNDSAAAVEGNDTEQDALTQRDLRRFPGGYQLGEYHLHHTGGSRVRSQRGAVTVLCHQSMVHIDDLAPAPLACITSTPMKFDSGKWLESLLLTSRVVTILVNCGDDDEQPRPVSQPDISATAFRNGNKVKEKYLWEAPEEDYELHEVEFRARERKKPISWS